MGTMNSIAAAVAAMGLLGSSAAQAMLLDRGGGLVFDTTLNITWLQDASYARTSGFDADGRMDWSAARAWADGLSYFDSVRQVTWSDWRLPITTDLGAPGCDWSYSGSDCGYNVSINSSELAHLYFVDLGNVSSFDAAGNPRGGRTGLIHTAPFQNVQSEYWSETEFVQRYISPGHGWAFFAGGGGQSGRYGSSEFGAWAVRPGDVSASASVPEPISLSLFGGALAAFALLRRRRP